MSRKEKYKKENFEKIVSESSSIKDALKKMNLRAAGGNYKVFHKYIKLYNLDISHFEERIKIYQRTLEVYKKNNKKPLNEILVENSDFSRTHLKERLYEEGIKKRECEECGQGEMWRDKKISLILDHKNGVYNDNRLNNLRILCPNCNATLETHAGKNNKKKTIKEIKEKYIHEKPLIVTRKVQRPPLKQLLEEVKELGYVGTGNKYGVSDNAIRKWINSYKKYGI